MDSLQFQAGLDALRQTFDDQPWNLVIVTDDMEWLVEDLDSVKTVTHESAGKGPIVTGLVVFRATKVLNRASEVLLGISEDGDDAPVIVEQLDSVVRLAGYSPDN